MIQFKNPLIIILLIPHTSITLNFLYYLNFLNFPIYFNYPDYYYFLIIYYYFLTNYYYFLINYCKFLNYANYFLILLPLKLIK